MHSVELPVRPWEKVFVDIYRPFPRSRIGNNCILIMIVTFSKFLIIFPIRDMKAMNIVKVLVERGWKFFGGPELFKEMCFEWWTKHTSSSPYYPFTAHNNRFFTKYFFLGRELPSPLLKIWGIPPATLDANDGELYTNCGMKLILARNYKSGRIINIIKSFDIGYLVMCRHVELSNKATHVSSKLNTAYSGPNKVLKFLTPVTVLLSDPANKYATNVSVRDFSTGHLAWWHRLAGDGAVQGFSAVKLVCGGGRVPGSAEWATV
ncbi:hypothetical protein PR048_020188 [Dryococelus australis]|uniref:Uncharacterized protein n=1 Tax=Dryococelus australis TaxID=614101 RepID=A0ABQ9H5Q4_9NEOP|nr:hypothetical protein PR048_020188 [Dryococelus australis]